MKTPGAVAGTDGQTRIANKPVSVAQVHIHNRLQGIVRCVSVPWLLVVALWIAWCVVVRCLLPVRGVGWVLTFGPQVVGEPRSRFFCFLVLGGIGWTHG